MRDRHETPLRSIRALFLRSTPPSPAREGARAPDGREPRTRRQRRRWRTLLGAGLLLAAVFWALPVARFTRPLSAVLYARDGSLLSARVAADEQWRFPPRAEVPPKIAQCLIQFEDKRFRWHPGVDPLAVARAAWSNLWAGRVVSGASTLTMQTIRLWRDGRPRTYLEKIIEAVLAVRLEASESKARILAMYASNAPFGGNVVGIDAAAWRYFGAAPEGLSWAEAATLAVLPNNPALVHPGRNEAVLRARRDEVLDGLARRGVIAEADWEAARAEPVSRRPYPVPHLAPHLLGTLAANGARTFRSTLDPRLQKRLDAVVERHHGELRGNHVLNAAALVLDIHTGAVLAYVGNVLDASTRRHGGHVDIVRAPRSTGSTLKPMLYAAAIDAAELLPTQLLEDTPLRIGSFAPENYSRTFEGAVPAAAALARSLNVPAVRLLDSYGVDRFYDVLHGLGMTSLDRSPGHYGLSLILGGAEITLWELTGIYASMARLVVAAAHGEPVDHVVRPPHVLQGTEPPGTTAPFGPGATFVTLQAMLELQRPGVDASWREFARPRRVAWKTGTSLGFRDAWAVGVNPRYAVGVWAGNADGEGRPGLTGLAAAAPILFDIFSALPDAGWFEAPRADLVPVTICTHSGELAGPHCRDTETILAPRSSLQGPVCQYCRLLHLDARGRYRVHGDCEPVHAQKTEERFVLPPLMEWYYRQRHSDYEPVPPWRPDCIAALGKTAGVSLSLAYPKPGSAIYVPLELDGRRGKTVFQAGHRDPSATIYWHLDDAYVGMTRTIHELALAPAPGPHVLTLVDDNGEVLERHFVVLRRESASTASDSRADAAAAR